MLEMSDPRGIFIAAVTKKCLGDVNVYNAESSVCRKYLFEGSGIQTGAEGAAINSFLSYALFAFSRDVSRTYVMFPLRLPFRSRIVVGHHSSLGNRGPLPSPGQWGPQRSDYCGNMPSLYRTPLGHDANTIFYLP